MVGGGGALPSRIATACCARDIFWASGEAAGFNGLAAGEVGACVVASAESAVEVGAFDSLWPHAASISPAARTKPKGWNRLNGLSELNGRVMSAEYMCGPTAQIGRTAAPRQPAGPQTELSHPHPSSWIQ